MPVLLSTLPTCWCFYSANYKLSLCYKFD